MLVEVNTTLAGVTFVTSFAKFSPSMATFSEERTLSLPFCRWELSVMAKTQIGARKWCGVVVVEKDSSRGERLFVIVRSSGHSDEI